MTGIADTRRLVSRKIEFTAWRKPKGVTLTKHPERAGIHRQPNHLGGSVIYIWADLFGYRFSTLTYGWPRGQSAQRVD